MPSPGWIVDNMDKRFQNFLKNSLNSLKDNGLYKKEYIIDSPQQTLIETAEGIEAINFCSNNYLGLSNHPEIIEVAKKSLDDCGFGMSSVRFISGTQSIHKHLEHKISQFLQTEDTLLYSSCFDANTGLFEALLGEEDAVISDALNHASIIDGIKLCKAKRYRYSHNDMQDLEEQLKKCQESRFRLIVTDGVFSMEGTFANLPKICELADRYSALIMVDDSHATGFIGPSGRGTPEYFGVIEKVDIMTGTLGKALGGAQGGYTSGRQEIIDWLRQRSRPYLFSNALAPVIAAGSLKALDIIQNPSLRETLAKHTVTFRARLSALGFNVIPGTHPIIPVLIGDAVLSGKMAARLLAEGIYVVSFSYPVVPQNQARIRIQLCATHTQDQLDKALVAFEKVGRECKVIS